VGNLLRFPFRLWPLRPLREEAERLRAEGKPFRVWEPVWRLFANRLLGQKYAADRMEGDGELDE